MLTERRIDLIPATADDGACALAVFCDDPLVTQYVGWRPVHTDDAARRMVEHLVAGAERGRPFWWIRRREDDALLGSIIAAWDGDEVETSYVLRREHWGNGYATEAVQAVVALAFADPDITRVRAFCDAENAASRCVLEKAGFRLDAHLPAHGQHNISTEPRDCLRLMRER